MWISHLWPVIGFCVALGFQVSGYINVWLAYSFWGLATIICIVGYWSKIKGLTAKKTSQFKAKNAAQYPIDLICPGGPPYWDKLPGYQIRRVGVTNNSFSDLVNVNVWLEDITHNWNHNLGATRLREKDDVPRLGSHIFKQDARITPGDTKFFDVVEVILRHFLKEVWNRKLIITIPNLLSDSLNDRQADLSMPKRDLLAALPYYKESYHQAEHIKNKKTRGQWPCGPFKF